MKMLLVFLVVIAGGLLVFPSRAQTNYGRKAGGSGGGRKQNAANAAADAQHQADEQAKANLAEAQKYFQPRDPWRVIDGTTNAAKGLQWKQFAGKVAEVLPEGLLVEGWHGAPMDFQNLAEGTNFLLKHFPHPLKAGALLPREMCYVARAAADDGGRKVLDYGQPWYPPKVQASAESQERKKSEAEAKVLAWHQELASQGDAYGQYKMGLRYLNGDGVPKDEQAGRDLLAKSAAQGNPDAAAELTRLEVK